MDVLHLGWSVWAEGLSLTTDWPDSPWSFYWRGRLEAKVPGTSPAKLAWEIQKENLFENVRRSHFSAAPSRQRCLFTFPPDCTEEAAIEKLESMALVESHVPPHWKVLMRLELGVGSFHIGDFKLLNVGPLSPDEVTQEAHRYWRGEGQPNELLYEGPFRVARILKHFKPT